MSRTLTRMQHYSQNGRQSGPSYIWNGMTTFKIQTKLLPLILMDVLRRHRFKGTLSFNLSRKLSFWSGQVHPKHILSIYCLKMIAKTMSLQEKYTVGSFQPV